MGENNTVVATLDGVINYEPGGTLVVNPAHEHSGDVDLKSGDLKMNGAIVVTDDVARNAKVEATEGVVIKGMIDAGAVECDGPVTVEGGVVVEDKAWIRAGGNVTCRHTQGARIESKETITIQQNSVNSFLTAKIIAGESESARILGGVLAAEELIVVGEAGSELGARTVLSVAVPLNWEYPSVADKLGGSAKAGSGKKDKPKKGKREKGQSPRQQIKKLLETARIEVRGKLHSGVVIEMGELSKTIEREVQRVQFRYSIVNDEPKILMEGISGGDRGDAKGNA